MNSELNPSPGHLNLVVAWVGILLGFLSGMVMGLFFERDDWLGGYGSFRRRMYRLGHISFFGLGAANLFFWLTARTLTAPGTLLAPASWGFVLGALTMPLCCVALAHRRRLQLLFAVPVISLITGAALTLVTLLRQPAAPGIADARDVSTRASVGIPSR